MATIKIPYSYKQYQNSKIATFVDKFCHVPSRIAWVLIISLALLFYYMVCFSAFPLSDEVNDLLGTVGVGFFVVSFIGSFFLGLICDKCKLSERVALWDVNGRKFSVRAKVVIALLAAVLILPGVAAAGIAITNGAQEKAYHETMSPLANPDSVAVEEGKAVTFEEDRFSRLYIPGDLQAEAPEEARYILYCTDGEDMVGSYGLSGVGAYKRWRLVEVVDRESGETIASETFYGGEPPRSVSDDTKNDQYGSRPSEEEISAWVAGVLPAA